MTEEREVTVEGIPYRVVISDEQEALLAAKAAGRAFVGLWRGGSVPEDDHVPGAGSVPEGVTAQADSGSSALWEAGYLVDSLEAADDRFLERVVRRKLGLPWIIAESERICIREFTSGDAAQVPKEDTDAAGGTDDAVFYTPEELRAYIRNQYGFYEYGIWAVVRKSDGRLVGKAGVSDCDIQRWEREETAGGTVLKKAAEPNLQLELGYHMFHPYRRQGYAEEACRLILDYVEQEYGYPVYAAVDADNTASIHLLEKLGFRVCAAAPAIQRPDIRQRVTAQKYNGSAPRPCLYVHCWK